MPGLCRAFSHHLMKEHAKCLVYLEVIFTKMASTQIYNSILFHLKWLRWSATELHYRITMNASKFGLRPWSKTCWIILAHAVFIFQTMKQLLILTLLYLYFLYTKEISSRVHRFVSVNRTSIDMEAMSLKPTTPKQQIGASNLRQASKGTSQITERKTR
jgi:hypothetical protein